MTASAHYMSSPMRGQAEIVIAAQRGRVGDVQARHLLPQSRGYQVRFGRTARVLLHLALLASAVPAPRGTSGGRATRSGPGARRQAAAVQ